MSNANTETHVLISALKILSEEIDTQDGVANAAIAEAAERLEDLYEALDLLVSETKQHCRLWSSWRNADELLKKGKLIEP